MSESTPAGQNPPDPEQPDPELQAALDEIMERNNAEAEFARLDEARAKAEQTDTDKDSGEKEGKRERKKKEPKDGEDDGPIKSQATRLVELALEQYRMVRGSDGKTYATLKAGSSIAIPMRGDNNGLRAILARAYYMANKAAPGSTALTDALTVLEGIAAEQDVEQVNLRVAESGECLVLDLARADGACVVIRPGSWSIEPVSPVLFRRTRLSGPVPDPEHRQAGADDPLDKLRDLLNVGESGFRLIVAWLVAALFPEIAHPMLPLFGEQGTAKSTAARLVAMLVDPSDAPLRTPPKDYDAWTTQAAASWIVVLDNLSKISVEFSDTLCRAVTGAGTVTRAMYSNDDVSVLNFRRCVGLTSIDAGAFKGDLGERAMPIGLEVIPPEKRRSEEEVNTAFARDRSAILGAILDLTAQVVLAKRKIKVERLHRLADFTLILAALDQVTGWSTLPDFMQLADEMTESVIEADPFADVVRTFVQEKGPWQGTAKELLEQITPAMPPRNWPKTPQGISGHLTRIAPALRANGIEIERLGREGHSGHRQMRLTFKGDPK